MGAKSYNIYLGLLGSNLLKNRFVLMLWAPALYLWKKSNYLYVEYTQEVIYIIAALACLANQQNSLWKSLYLW